MSTPIVNLMVKERTVCAKMVGRTCRTIFQPDVWVSVPWECSKTPAIKTGFSIRYCNLTRFTLDINECDRAESPCGKNAVCVNSPGGFSCQCQPNFTGNAFRGCVGE